MNNLCTHVIQQKWNGLYHLYNLRNDPTTPPFSFIILKNVLNFGSTDIVSVEQGHETQSEISLGYQKLRPVEFRTWWFRYGIWMISNQLGPIYARSTLLGIQQLSPHLNQVDPYSGTMHDGRAKRKKVYWPTSYLFSKQKHLIPNDNIYIYIYYLML